MCNSRGITDKSDKSASKKATKPSMDLSKYNFKCTPSKLGRKGDPRMQKALEARLKSPSLTLLEALEIGGFQFHWRGDISYDSDNIQLSQRKNQLSRRLRLFKNNLLKTREGDASAIADESTEAPRVKQPSAPPKKKKNKDKDKKKPVVPKASKKKARAPDDTETNAAITRPVDMVPEPTVQSNEEPCMPKLSGYTELLATETDSMPTCNHPNSNFPHQLPHITPADPIDGSFMPLQIKSDINDFAEGQILTSASSSSASSYTSFSPSLTPKTIEMEDPRLVQALDMYSSKSSAVMKLCMISAGFSNQEAEEYDEHYVAFFERALENGKSRLEEIKSSLLTNRMAERDCGESLPLTSSAALHFPTDQDFEAEESIQLPPMVQSLVSPLVPSEIMSSSCANTLSGSNLLGISSLSHLQEVTSAGQNSNSFYLGGPFQGNLIHNNSITNNAGHGWNPIENFAADASNEFNPLISDLPTDLDFGISENVNGPKVLDLKHINLDGEEWKTILQKTKIGRSGI